MYYVFNYEQAGVSVVPEHRFQSYQWKQSSSSTKEYFRGTTLCPRTVIRSEVLQSFSRAQAPVSHTVDSLSTNGLTYIPVAPNFYC